MFGCGHLSDVREVYVDVLRGELTRWSRLYWDRRIDFIADPQRPFFFRGMSGTVARAANAYVNRVIDARAEIDALLDAPSVEHQREIYESRLRDRLWSRPMRFALDRDATLSMVGVPRAQRRQVETHYEGGIVAFIQQPVAKSGFGRARSRQLRYFLLAAGWGVDRELTR